MLLLFFGAGASNRQASHGAPGIVLTNKKIGPPGVHFSRKRWKKLQEELEQERRLELEAQARAARELEAQEQAEREAEEQRRRAARAAADREVKRLREFAESVSRQAKPLTEPLMVQFDNRAEMAARAHQAAMDEDDAIAMLLLNG